jgi:hypothetical protein
MAYVSVAKGNRPGGANRPIPVSRCALDIAQGGGSVPQSYTDDTVWSYELGTKDRFLDHKLAIDGSIYYLQWHNVQQNLILSNCNFSYVGNFGSATSKGFDLSARLTPAPSVEIGLKTGYTDSALSQNVVGSVNQTTGVAPVLATEGSPLTLVPKWTADVDLEFRHELPWSGTAGFARLDYEYQGSFTRTPGPGSTLFNPITYQGQSYSTLNFRTGVNKDGWQGTFFINNLTNAYPTLFLATEAALTGYLNFENTLPPRTYGAKVSYSW